MAVQVITPNDLADEFQVVGGKLNLRIGVGLGVGPSGEIVSTAPVPTPGDDPITTKAAGSVASNGTAQEIINATVVRAAQGQYDVTFTTPAPSATYPVLATMEGLPQNDDYQWAYLNRTVNGFRLEIREQDNGGAAGVLRDSGFSFQVLTLG